MALIKIDGLPGFTVLNSMGMASMANCECHNQRVRGFDSDISDISHSDCQVCHSYHYYFDDNWDDITIMGPNVLIGTNPRFFGDNGRIMGIRME